MIVVDDASTDSSAQIVEDLARTDSRIVLVRNQKNLGVIESINRGVATARGEFIYMTGCDDLPLPGLFEKSAALLAQFPHAPACISHPCDWKEGGDEVTERIPNVAEFPGFFRPDELAIGLSDMPWVHPHSGLLRKTAFERYGGYDTALGASADWFFWMSLIFREGGCYIPEPLSLWRMRENSYLAVSFNDEAQKQRMVRSIIATLLSEAYDDVYPFFVVSNALANFGYATYRAILLDKRNSTPKGMGLLHWQNADRSKAVLRSARKSDWRLTSDLERLVPIAPEASDDSRENAPVKFRGIRRLAQLLGIYELLRKSKWRLLHGRSPPPLEDAAQKTPQPSKLEDVLAISRKHEGAGNLESAIGVLREWQSATDHPKAALLVRLGTLEFKNSEFDRAAETLKAASAATDRG